MKKKTLNKISVIVPVYNVEQYLDKCVESIVNQTYKNLEIILVDDGSPDNCPKMCDDWAKKDERIKVIHKQNDGQSMARNDGLSIFTGDFVMFVDSDDWIEESACELLIQNQMDENSDLVLCRRNRADCNGNKSPLIEKRFHEFIENPNPLFLVCDYVTPWCTGILYKSGVIKNFRFKKMTFGEDLCFLLELLQNNVKITHVDKELYNYRLNENSITQIRSEDQCRRYIDSEIQVINLLRALNYTNLAEYEEFKCYFYSALKYYDHSEWLNGIRQFNNKKNYKIFKNYSTFKKRLIAFLIRHNLFKIIKFLKRIRASGK